MEMEDEAFWPHFDPTTWVHHPTERCFQVLGQGQVMIGMRDFTLAGRKNTKTFLISGIISVLGQHWMYSDWGRLRKDSGPPLGVSENAYPSPAQCDVIPSSRVPSGRRPLPSKATANQERNIPCPFQYTRQLDNCLNYSFVNISSFTQPFFFVREKTT